MDSGSAPNYLALRIPAPLLDSPCTPSAVLAAVRLLLAAASSGAEMLGLHLPVAEKSRGRKRRKERRGGNQKMGPNTEGQSEKRN